MNLTRYRGAWSKVVSYAAFFASSPGHIPALLRGARYRAGFHVGELIKIARMRPALDVGTIGTIIDVGANRGQFSLTARMLAPSIRIVAVEPLPSCAMFLRHAIGQGRGRVIEMAAGMEEGEVQFYEAAVDKSSSTLVMTELHHEEFPWTGVSASSVVRQGRLDSMIDVDELVGNVLLKVDVQGAELAALMSASGLLPRIDAVIVEVDFEEHYVGQSTPDDIVRFLLDSGFHFAGVVELLERHSDAGVVQADLLFRRALQVG